MGAAGYKNQCRFSINLLNPGKDSYFAWQRILKNKPHPVRISSKTAAPHPK
jgi:hypothetical protein